MGPGSLEPAVPRIGSGLVPIRFDELAGSPDRRLHDGWGKRRMADHPRPAHADDDLLLRSVAGDLQPHQFQGHRPESPWERLPEAGRRGGGAVRASGGIRGGRPVDVGGIQRLGFRDGKSPALIPGDRRHERDPPRGQHPGLSRQFGRSRDYEDFLGSCVGAPPTVIRETRKSTIPAAASPHAPNRKRKKESGLFQKKLTASTSKPAITKREASRIRRSMGVITREPSRWASASRTPPPPAHARCAPRRGSPTPGMRPYRT